MPYLALCAAERFGAGGSGSPVDWWDRLGDDEQATLIAFERLRRVEQARLVAAGVRP